MLQLYEGYGQTECTAGCSMSLPGDWIAGKFCSKPFNLNFDPFPHYYELYFYYYFFLLITQGVLALLYPAMTLNWWT